MVDDNPDMMAIRPDENDVAVPVSQWRRHCRRLLTSGCIAAATVAGAALPLLLVDSGFRGYVSQARIEVSQTAYDAPDAARFLAMARRTLLSPSGLDRITADLKLKSADMVGVRNQGELGLLFDLLTGADARPLSEREALNGAVGEAIRLELTPDENTLIVTGKAATPETAMRLTDYLSMRVIADGKAGTMTPAMRETERARTRLDEAEAALNGFQMRHGDAVMAEAQQLEQQLRDVNDSLERTTRQQLAIQADLTAASALKPNDVFAKPLPAGVGFSALEDIRQKYSTASMALAAVSVDYGPKHPRRIAAQNAVDAAQALAAPALRQLLEGLRADEKRISQEIATANGEQKKYLDRLNELGVAPGEFSRLQGELETARNVYLEASERRDLSASATPAVETRLVKKAAPGELTRDLTQAAMLAGGGALIGLMGSLYLLSYRRHDEEEEGALLIEEGAQLPSSVEPPVESLQISEFEPIEPAVFDDLPDVAAEDIKPEEDGFADYYGEAVNDDDDVPLDERVRQVLMGNRTVRSADPASSGLPPLLAEALAGDFDHAQAEAEELMELRRELAFLRERLADYADRREDYRKTA
ncbi:GumC family protein [Agrobacterium tumefaciens]|uniref:GumC family protein n=1 Tax=Agrobacterium tumefaciens TaxID=358 RepID=UPI001574B96A|nr:GumC family protein [Agrobacterium tumefaciens]NTE33536.1 GumC family protein [Agrobacterium tumefaciens]NTE49046.1 GumC family protein [Agrobacterium tumefaciens]